MGLAIERFVLWVTFLALVALLATYGVSHTLPASMPNGWDYKDVVSMLLAIVTVALTVLGIIVAIAAFVGFQKISEIAAENAERSSDRRTDEFFGSDAFNARVEAVILERMKNMRKDELGGRLDVGAANEPAAAPVGPVEDEPWVDDQ